MNVQFFNKFEILFNFVSYNIIKGFTKLKKLKKFINGIHLNNYIIYRAVHLQVTKYGIYPY